MQPIYKVKIISNPVKFKIHCDKIVQLHGFGIVEDNLSKFCRKRNCTCFVAVNYNYFVTVNYNYFVTVNYNYFVTVNYNYFVTVNYNYFVWNNDSKWISSRLRINIVLDKQH